MSISLSQVMLNIEIMLKLTCLSVDLIQLVLGIYYGSTNLSVLFVYIYIKVSVILNVLFTTLNYICLVFNLIDIVFFQALNILFKTGLALT